MNNKERLLEKLSENSQEILSPFLQHLSDVDVTVGPEGFSLDVPGCEAPCVFSGFSYETARQAAERISISMHHVSVD